MVLLHQQAAVLALTMEGLEQQVVQVAAQARMAGLVEPHLPVKVIAAVPVRLV